MQEIPAILLLMLCGASVLATRGMIALAPALGLVDVPEARSAHFRPVPHGGGVAITAVFTTFLFIAAFNGDLTRQDLLLLLSALPIALVGLVDDWRSLGYRRRIVTQLLMAVLVFTQLGELPELYMGGVNLQLGILAWLLVPLAMTWLCNLYNFMDGIDGLAASQAIFVTLAAAWLAQGQSPGLALLCLALAAATAGFLVWNWSPARVFMGDVGSTWLGFTFGILILISLRDQILTIWVWFLLLSPFIVDTGWTLGVRLARGHPPYEPHSTHAYQHAARRWGHRRVVAVVMTINLLYVVPLAWLAEYHPHFGVYIAISGIVPFIAICWRLGAGIGTARPAGSVSRRRGDQENG